MKAQVVRLGACKYNAHTPVGDPIFSTPFFFKKDLISTLKMYGISYNE